MNHQNRITTSERTAAEPTGDGNIFVSYFVDVLWGFFLYCVCYAFVCVCLYVPCGHLLGKGWPLGSRLWCLTVSLSLSHWYPGSGVVLDCVDSWSLHPYLLWSTSELRVRFAPWNCFKPSSIIIYWPFQGGASFVVLSRLFFTAVWSPAGKGLSSWLLFVMFNCVFITFPCGILGQVWCLIVSFPNLWRLSYLDIFYWPNMCPSCRRC